MTGKKVVGSKNVFYKSFWEFYILVGDFFFTRLKKVIKSKKDFNKSCPKFYKLGNEFFLFWRNLKIMDSRAKKRFSDFAYKTRVFSPGAPKNQNHDKKFYRHAHIA